MTQNARILNYMERRGSITSYEAFMHLNVTRLAARISELREELAKDGKYIYDDWIERGSGDKKRRFKKYLKPEKLR